METAIPMSTPTMQGSNDERAAVKALAGTADKALMISETAHKEHMAATVAMVEFVREHRGHINSFNTLVNEAVARPDWLAALMEPGICNLMRTYCHD